MKKLYSLALSITMLIGLMAGMTSCGGDDENEDPVEPKITISLRSCSISEGTEYNATDLKEVTLSYNNVVSVSPSATSCSREPRATWAYTFSTSC